MKDGDRFRRVLLAALAVFTAGCAGERPGDLGVRDGRLAPCRPTPNCVNSRADRATDPEHAIAPIAFRGDAAKGWILLVGLVRDTGRARIITERPDYLYAEYASRIFGFVDDVEFQLDRNANVVHIRSASRLGHSDFGVNRARIEDLRARLAAGGG